MDKCRIIPPEAAIIARHRRRQSSVEEALLEIYFAPILLWRLAGTTERLWDAPAKASDVCRLAETVMDRIHGWRERPLGREYAYVYCTDVEFETERVSGSVASRVCIAVGVNPGGCREVLGVDSAGCAGGPWDAFLDSLRRRGLSGVELLVAPGDARLEAAVARRLPRATYQRCVRDFYDHVLARAQNRCAPNILAMLKAIHAGEDRDATREKADQVVRELDLAQFLNASAARSHGLEGTLQYYDFPHPHWASLRSLLPFTRLLGQMRERHRVLNAYAEEGFAVLLVSAWLRHVAGTVWQRRRLTPGGDLSDEESMVPDFPGLTGFAGKGIDRMNTGTWN